MRTHVWLYLSIARVAVGYPTIIDHYLENGPLTALATALREDFQTPTTLLRPQEKAVLRLLEKTSKESDAQRTTKALARSLRKTQKT